MHRFGIGYGQRKDFESFLEQKGVDFNSLSENDKKRFVRLFLSREGESIKKDEKIDSERRETPKNTTKDLRRYYDENIRSKFDIKDLKETILEEVFLKKLKKKGWALKIVTIRQTFIFPFSSQKNCERVASWIWQEWYPYGEKKYKEKNAKRMENE